VRGPALGGGLFLDLDAFELAHGETFTSGPVVLNIQDAEERQKIAKRI
jgi:hypothetical protein